MQFWKFQTCPKTWKIGMHFSFNIPVTMQFQKFCRPDHSVIASDILKSRNFSSSRQFFNFIGDNVSAEPFSSQFYKLILFVLITKGPSREKNLAKSQTLSDSAETPPSPQ